MTRPQDWSALGWGSDPVPGDPGTVATVASKYRSTADAVSQASTNLARLDMSENKSLGLATVLDQIKAVRTQLDDVESRVDGAAAALEYYAPRLGDAQRLSLEALSDAEAARQAAQSSQRHRDDAASDYYGTNDPAQRDAAKDRYNSYNQQVREANRELASAKEKLRKAIEERDAAAKTATDSLQSIDQSSPVHDNLVDYFNEWANKLLDFWDQYVEPWLDDVCNLLDVASLVLTLAAFVLSATGIGAGLAVGLFAIAKVLSVITTVAKSVKLAIGGLKAIEGRESWADFGKDAAMFGVGLVLAKVTGARASTGVAKGFSSMKIDALQELLAAKPGIFKMSVGSITRAVGYATGKASDLVRDLMGHDSSATGESVRSTYRVQTCGAL